MLSQTHSVVKQLQKTSLLHQLRPLPISLLFGCCIGQCAGRQSTFIYIYINLKHVSNTQNLPYEIPALTRGTIQTNRTRKKLYKNLLLSHLFIARINRKTRTNDCMMHPFYQVPKRLRSMARPKASSWATNLETPSVDGWMDGWMDGGMEGGWFICPKVPVHYICTPVYISLYLCRM